MNRYKTLCVLIALAAVAMLAGCGQTQTQTASPAPAAQQATPASQAGKGTISKDEALNIALHYADIPADQAYHTKIDMDKDARSSLYDVEFKTDNGEYDVKVDAQSGDIAEADYEADKNWVRRQAYQPISQDQAKEMVLSQIPDASPRDIQIRPKQDDGMSCYEGTVYAGSGHYEFEIDADTGIIMEWDVDMRK